MYKGMNVQDQVIKVQKHLSILAPFRSTYYRDLIPFIAANGASQRYMTT